MNRSWEVCIIPADVRQMSEKPEEESREIIDQLLAGATLAGVEIQTARYSEGLPVFES